jgi:hypothetical protein
MELGMRAHATSRSSGAIAIESLEPLLKEFQTLFISDRF